LSLHDALPIYEREGNARHRQRVDHTADVDHGLRQYPTGDPDRDETCERVRLACGDPQARPAEGAEARENDEGSDETEIAGYDGKDEVGVRIGEEPPGRDRCPDAASGDPAEPESGKRLHDLVAGGRGVGERVDERQQAITPVG